jgi:hypothetical protein
VAQQAAASGVALALLGVRGQLDSGLQADCIPQMSVTPFLRLMRALRALHLDEIMVHTTKLGFQNEEGDDEGESGYLR